MLWISFKITDTFLANCAHVELSGVNDSFYLEATTLQELVDL